MRRIWIGAFLAAALPAAMAWAHVGEHPSVHDTVANIIERMKETLEPEKLVGLSVDEVLEFLTDEEEHILGTQHLTFRVNVPVVVSVIRDANMRNEPYWLFDREFRQTDMRVTAGGRQFDVWQKPFDAGVIGLGVNSLSGSGRHYFVIVGPQEAGADLEITEVYPGLHRVGKAALGETYYLGWDDTIEALPDDLSGQVLLHGVPDRDEDGQLTNLFRMTPYPSKAEPDHIVLTWSDDPRTSQAVQWRTSTAVSKGVVAYLEKARYKAFDPGDPLKVDAVTTVMEDEMLLNDPICHRHTAVMTGLKPDTTYVYSVGDGSVDGWTELAEFTTAPDGIEPFSFIYMGDAQNGLERWRSLVHTAYNTRPDARFYVMAGDLVNRGAHRDDWDVFFNAAEGVFDRRQLVPALGNHEYHNPQVYLDMFHLPMNGSDAIQQEKSYAFEYSNALFVVLDSNEPAEYQTEWLEAQLANTDATWKFVVYHHPAYSSGPRRDNPDIRALWGALFDKYHVDLALQGHDHAYLRTYPMRDGKPVDSPAEGTIYIVSVSGTKYYDQGDFDYTEFGMTNVSTYQVLDVQIMGDRLVYRSYDGENTLRDEFVIEK